MKQYVLCFIFIIVNIYQVFAQLIDNFSDGNFSSNPVWSGSNDFFEIENQKLKSKGNPFGGEHYLSVPNTRIDETEWRFLVDLKFNPSNTNQIKIYLTASDADLMNPLEGYFLQIGQSGDDKVYIYKQTGTKKTLVTSSVSTFSGNLLLSIKVTREGRGKWTFYVDPTGNENFIYQGFFYDTTYQSTSYFGVVYAYTASNKDLFYFDDFYIGDFILDKEPPELSSFKIIDKNRIELNFDEAVKKSIAENKQNYNINNGIGEPYLALRAFEDYQKIKLVFDNDFIDGKQYSLTINNIEDNFGNAMNSKTVNFTYYQTFPPDYHDLVISEIFPDPVGQDDFSLGLPKAEFIEIYNRSHKRIQLEGCLLSDVKDTVTLPNFIIPPKTYKIVCAKKYKNEFAVFGDVIALDKFPALNNDFDRLILRNKNGKLVFVVAYTDKWYNHKTKQQGAWSLEMKDVNNPCLEEKNWTASNHSLGGTPGKENSIQEIIPDLFPPILLRAEGIGAFQIKLTFNKKLDSLSAIKADYQIDNNIEVEDVWIDLENSLFKVVYLKLKKQLLVRTKYKVSVSGVRDCNGNQMISTSKIIGLSESADSTDIIINEILFNPRKNGSDFVELYNQSEKFINLKNWGIARLYEEVPDGFVKIADDDFVIAPKSYLVLSNDIKNIKANYPKSKEEVFWELRRMPSFNDDEGTFLLFNELRQVLEKFAYHEKFHFDFLKDNEGVSLERIAFDVPTNQQDSWKSAAADVGFATPGYLNSQHLTKSNVQASVSITPKTITPDNDGYKDYATIHYNFTKSNYIMNINIFDRSGRKVKSLMNNQSIGTSKGVITWNGNNDAGNTVSIGYYLVLIEVFNLEGEKIIYKEKVVVGMKF